MSFLLLGTENIGVHFYCHLLASPDRIQEPICLHQLQQASSSALSTRAASNSRSPNENIGFNRGKEVLGAGIQVEEPFCILTMRAFCRNCENSVREILETYEGEHARLQSMVNPEGLQGSAWMLTTQPL